MALIKCPHCGANISDRAKQCPKCGTTLGAPTVDNNPKFCTKCGAELQDSASFCTMCGAATSPHKEENNQKEGNEQQGFGKKSSYALLIVLGLIALAIGATFIYSSYSEKREARLAREKFVADSIMKVKKDSIQQVEQARQDSIKHAEKLNSIQPYLNELKELASDVDYSKDEYGENIDMWVSYYYYFLCDLTGDEFPELCVNKRNNDGMQFRIYTSKSGVLQLLYSENLDEAPMHYSFHQGGNYVIYSSRSVPLSVDGITQIYINRTKYIYNGNKVTKNIIIDGVVNDDPDAIEEPVPTTYSFRDSTPIYDIIKE